MIFTDYRTNLQILKKYTFLTNFRVFMVRIYLNMSTFPKFHFRSIPKFVFDYTTIKLKQKTSQDIDYFNSSQFSENCGSEVLLIWSKLGSFSIVFPVIFALLASISSLKLLLETKSKRKQKSFFLHQSLPKSFVLEFSL